MSGHVYAQLVLHAEDLADLRVRCQDDTRSEAAVVVGLQPHVRTAAVHIDTLTIQGDPEVVLAFLDTARTRLVAEMHKTWGASPTLIDCEVGS